MSCGTEIGTIQGTDGEVLGITSGSVDRRKPGVDEVSGLVLSGGPSEGTWVDNFEDAGPG